MNPVLFLIDDDADDRFMFEEALQHVAPQSIFYWAENGQEAMALLRSGTVKMPQVILLDINMPVANGWQFLFELKADNHFKSIPVIMYSTSSHKEDIDKARSMGALCFFTKPNDFEELEKLITMVILHLNMNSIHALSEDPEFFTGK
jgi:CheY-like chemotaxis protein